MTHGVCLPMHNESRRAAFHFGGLLTTHAGKGLLGIPYICSSLLFVNSEINVEEDLVQIFSQKKRKPVF